jgi:septum formation protein
MRVEARLGGQRGVRVVLASASPRRKELLAALLDGFEVAAANVPEPPAHDPVADAERLALAKARHAAEACPDALVIGADTVVHDGRQPFGKPADAGDARAMLRDLQGRPHTVVTGVAVCAPGFEQVTHSRATVTMAPLTDAQVDDYVASGRPLDKAGAYAIQDEDVPTVAALCGCYCCVVGLPLWRLRGLLIAAGVAARRPDEAFERCAACPERPAPDV